MSGCFEKDCGGEKRAAQRHRAAPAAKPSTSRTVIARILDVQNTSITLSTRAMSALGCRQAGDCHRLARFRDGGIRLSFSGGNHSWNDRAEVANPNAPSVSRLRRGYGRVDLF